MHLSTLKTLKSPVRKMLNFINFLNLFNCRISPGVPHYPPPHPHPATQFLTSSSTHFEKDWLVTALDEQINSFGDERLVW